MKLNTMACLAPLFALISGAPLDKRVSGTITYYSQGLGACGQTSSDSDLVAAIPPGSYGNGENCGRSIQVTANDKSVTVRVTDECVSCVGLKTSLNLRYNEELDD